MIDLCRLCYNRTNELCDPCSRGGELMSFELHPNASLENLSKFPIKEFLESFSPHVRQVIVAVYIKLMFDQMGGSDGTQKIP